MRPGSTIANMPSTGNVDDGELDDAAELRAGDVAMTLDELSSAHWLSPEAWQVLATSVVAAIADQDGVTINLVEERLVSLVDAIERPEERGAARLLLTLAAAALREPSQPGRGPLEPGTLPARVLEHLVNEPQLTNRDLCARTGASDSQLSRAGRRLTADGLLIRRKVGRSNRWVITPAGQRAAAGLALSPRASIDNAHRIVSKILNAPTDDEKAELARELLRHGINERRSANSRGSLVQAAAPRLPPPAELALVDQYLAIGAKGRIELAASLGEWGSSPTAGTLGGMLSPSAGALSRRTDIAVLRQIGGPSASTALIDLLEASAREASPDSELVAELLGAIEVLVVGGRIDVTEPGPAVGADIRWLPDDLGTAGSLVARLLDVLDLVSSHAALTDHVGVRAEASSGATGAWATANGIEFTRHSPIVRSQGETAPAHDVVAATAPVAEATGWASALLAALHATLEETASGQRKIRASAAAIVDPGTLGLRLFPVPAKVGRVVGGGAQALIVMSKGELIVQLHGVSESFEGSVLVGIVSPAGGMHVRAASPAGGQDMWDARWPWEEAGLPASLAFAAASHAPLVTFVQRVREKMSETFDRGLRVSVPFPVVALQGPVREVALGGSTAEPTEATRGESRSVTVDGWPDAFTVYLRADRGDLRVEVDGLPHVTVDLWIALDAGDEVVLKDVRVVDGFGQVRVPWGVGLPRELALIVDE